MMALNRVSRPLMTALLLLGLTCPMASALEKISTTESINKTILHAARHREAGIASLLGPNWVEGDNGALLNVYSPFMMLASKAAKIELPAEPSVEDYQNARKNMARLISQLQDPKLKQEVKFAVSLYGRTPNFAGQYFGRIKGYGRGVEVELKPTRQVLDKIADPVSNARDEAYSAINSYYFRFEDLAELEDLEFTLENPSGERQIFRLNAKHLY